MRFFLRCLFDYLPESGCAIHAYVLMTNHVHLLVSPASSAAAFSLMKPVTQKYAQYFNRKYKRVGTLWQGRYRSSPIETERYFLACHRYIELNPVRAGLASEPGAYPWSSYRANALGETDVLVANHSIFSALGADKEQRHQAYRALFDEALTEVQVSTIRDAINGNAALGSARFAEYIRSTTGRRAVRHAAGRPARD